MAHNLLPKEQSLALLDLYRKQPWLRDDNRDKAVEELIGQCNTHELFLVVDLLTRFRFVDDVEYREMIREVARRVVNTPLFTQDNTQIVGFTADKEADSAQAMLQAIKKEFAVLGWDHPKTANMLGHSIRNLPKYPNIVLVDEFVGTGKTLEGRLKWLDAACTDAVCKGKAPLGYNVSVYVLAAMEAGIDLFSGKPTPFTALVSLKRGISDYYVGKALRKACKWMLRLESTLEPEVHGKPMPTFGYGRAEALFGTNGNATNNLFPVFWWPYLVGQIRRSTLFYRAESAPE